MKIIQITDTHIGASPKDRIFGLVNTEDTFLDVLKSVKEECPDIVLATGDLSQDGSIDSYVRLKEYLSTLKCNVYAIYGNHDNKTNFDQHLIGGNIINTPALETDIGNFIFLNSLKEGSDCGFLSTEELTHLDKSLHIYDKCIPVIHHHFVPLGSCVDKYILENNDALIDILKKYRKKIKFCITGHVHGFYSCYIEDIKIYSSLSTCIQFAKTENLLFDRKKPGYTIYNFQGGNCEVAERTI